MQAIAPGNSGDLQAGHSAAGGAAAAARVSRSGAAGADTVPPPGGAAATAATGCRAGAGLTTKTFLQLGHRTCLPAALSGTWSSFWHCEHLMTWGMRGLDPDKLDAQARAVVTLARASSLHTHLRLSPSSAPCRSGRRRSP